MKSNTIIWILGTVFFLIGCGDGGCRTLSWQSSSSADTGQFSLKTAAGSKCGNYSDYYDTDLSEIIAKIQSMKFVLNRKCYEMTSIDSDPEEVEVECPEFIPETIEFGEMVRCSFGTPPDENTKCDSFGPELYFKSNYSDEIRWILAGDNDPKLFYGAESDVFKGMKDEIVISGHFNDESLTTATIVFTWTEDEEEKTLEFSAVVEIKE